MKKTDPAPGHIILHSEIYIKLFLVIFYIVGIIGFALPATSDFFIHLTPVALLLSVAVLIYFHETDQGSRSVKLFLLIFILSFLLEAAGVNSGFPFGYYSYGKGLGIKIFGTPLMIGINWILLVYCTNIIANSINTGMYFRIIIASLLMVIYDGVLEQIAPMIDMWHFEKEPAPLQNYIAWFMAAFIFQLIIRITGIKFNNRLASFIFILQITFFITLLILIKLLK